MKRVLYNNALFDLLASVNYNVLIVGRSASGIEAEYLEIAKEVFCH